MGKPADHRTRSGDRPETRHQPVQKICRKKSYPDYADQEKEESFKWKSGREE